MIADLILAAIQGLIKIGVGTAEDKQKREAEQLVAMREFFQKGADECALLLASRNDESHKTDAAFEDARKRIAGET